MKQEKIDRINFLARKSRTEQLTPEEKEEQERLRMEYRQGFIAGLTDQLEHTYIVDENGHKRRVEKRR